MGNKESSDRDKIDNSSNNRNKVFERRDVQPTAGQRLFDRESSPNIIDRRSIPHRIDGGSVSDRIDREGGPRIIDRRSIPHRIDGGSVSDSAINRLDDQTRGKVSITSERVKEKDPDTRDDSIFGHDCKNEVKPVAEKNHPDPDKEKKKDVVSNDSPKNNSTGGIDLKIDYAIKGLAVGLGEQRRKEEFTAPTRTDFNEKFPPTKGSPESYRQESTVDPLNPTGNKWLELLGDLNIRSEVLPSREHGRHEIRKLEEKDREKYNDQVDISRSKDILSPCYKDTKLCPLNKNDIDRLTAKGEAASKTEIINTKREESVIPTARECLEAVAVEFLGEMGPT